MSQSTSSTTTSDTVELLTPEAWGLLVDLATTELTRRGTTPTREGDLLRLDDTSTLDLHDLSAAVCGVPSASWPVLVSGYVDALGAGRERADRPQEALPGPGASAPTTRTPPAEAVQTSAGAGAGGPATLTLPPPEVEADPLADAPTVPTKWGLLPGDVEFEVWMIPPALAADGRVAWQVAPQLAAALIRVDGKRPQATYPGDLAGLGLQPDRAFDLAIARMRRQPVPPLTSSTPHAQAKLSWLSGDGPGTATQVLWLDELVPDVGAAGAVVAVPHRRALLVHVLTSFEEAVEGVNVLLLMAAELYAQGRSPLSPHLYWWRDGRLTLIPGEVEDGEVRCDPPADFVDVLQRLPT